jgi:Rrf2 family protein
MLKLSKKSEYALIAVQFLASKGPDFRIAVTELAAEHDLPRDLLAKVMQQLKRSGVLSSVQGVAGGYALARPPEAIRFLDVVLPFEDGFGLVDCVSSRTTGCDRADCCMLHSPMEALNAWLVGQLSRLTMQEFLAQRPPAFASSRVSRGRLDGSERETEAAPTAG